MIKPDLALNKLKWLMSHKTKPNHFCMSRIQYKRIHLSRYFLLLDWLPYQG